MIIGNKWRGTAFSRSFPPANICFLKAVYDQVIISEVKGQESVQGTLESILKKLPKTTFVQIHRQYAVSLDYINTVSPDGVTLINMPDVFLPISRKYYPGLMKKVKIVGVVVRKKIAVKKQRRKS